jgi:carboxyl-terminal processing protease
MLVFSLMTRRLWFCSIFLSLSLTVFGVRLYEAMAETTPEDSAYAKIAVFTRALQLIRQDYVDEQKIGYQDLLYSALRGMLAELDPHSQFMGPDDFTAMQEDTKSEFGGLGVVVSMRDGALTVVTPMEDTPGFKAGLLPGDQILKIDGNSTEKMDLSDAVQRLRGQPGEKVTLTILRPSTKDIKDYVIAREIIRVDSVKNAQLLGSTLAGDYKIGYVRITQFNEPTPEELRKNLDALEKQGMQALILDLRYNPGGLLHSAVHVLGEFLPANQMVVYTEGRAPSQKRVYRTPANSVNRKLPLAVLINNGSASGSEIVAGALKDLTRGILIGETTFGKGSVQSVIQLQDGSALRLTTAKYYTPGKQVIHEKGITPNIRSTLTPEQERLLLLQRREDILDEAEKREIAAFRDPQLERAADALKGVMVYSGVAAKDEQAVAPAKKAASVSAVN